MRRPSRLLSCGMCWGSLVLCLAFSGCREEILHDLSEGQANQVRVVLAQEHIPAEKFREGKLWSISVRNGDVTRALAGLEASRVLRRELQRSVEAGSSLMQSPEERFQHLERNTAWNLEQTLERMPLVLEARVHLSLQREVLGDAMFSDQKSTASVLIISATPERVDETEVQRLVAGASGLSAPGVTVVVAKANTDLVPATSSFLPSIEAAPAESQRSESTPPKSGQTGNGTPVPTAPKSSPSWPSWETVPSALKLGGAVCVFAIVLLIVLQVRKRRRVPAESKRESERLRVRALLRQEPEIVSTPRGDDFSVEARMS